ncbi:MAG: hypothetical protein LYZ66_03950 [Nitrososphaerales archaeon]|nr:hypothetical protein [Nitrososphaerales archaeon]
MRLAFVGILTFVTSLTIGNDPYLFFGYGISAFGMLTTGLLLDPLPATAVFFVASAAAMSLAALTRSTFTLVIVGAVLVRTIQVYFLSRFRPRRASSALQQALCSWGPWSRRSSASRSTEALHSAPR